MGTMGLDLSFYKKESEVFIPSNLSVITKNINIRTEDFDNINTLYDVLFEIDIFFFPEDFTNKILLGKKIVEEIIKNKKEKLIQKKELILYENLLNKLNEIIKKTNKIKNDKGKINLYKGLEAFCEGNNVLILIYKKIFHTYITHNLIEMANKIILSNNYTLYDVLWKGNEYGFETTKKIIKPLEEALEYMKNHKKELEKYNPSNGYGSYVDLVNKIREIINISKKESESIIIFDR